MPIFKEQRLRIIKNSDDALEVIWRGMSNQSSLRNAIEIKNKLMEKFNLVRRKDS